MLTAFYQEISETLIDQCKLKYKHVTMRIAVSSQRSVKQTVMPAMGSLSGERHMTYRGVSWPLAAVLPLSTDGLDKRFSFGGL